MARIRWLKRTVRMIKYGALSPEAAATKKHARRARRRRRVFASAAWAHDGLIARRRYGSYTDYVEHQASKLRSIHERREHKDADAVARFAADFEAETALAGCRVIVCLGARLGAEVEALHDLDYFAIGIDIEPGPKNTRVLYGDFHSLVFPDASIDAVYTNSLDHVYDFAAVTAEVARVLRADGALIIDAVHGFDEGFVPGDYEASIWRTTSDLVGELESRGPLCFESQRAIADRGRHEWTRIVMRKRKAPVATPDTSPNG